MTPTGFNLYSPAPPWDDQVLGAPPRLLRLLRQRFEGLEEVAGGGVRVQRADGQAGGGAGCGGAGGGPRAPRARVREVDELRECVG
jgi:hypothetical protein